MQSFKLTVIFTRKSSVCKSSYCFSMS